MPPVHIVSLPEQTVYTVTKSDVAHAAHVLQRNADQVYVHYINTNKRLDEWVPADTCVLAPDRTPPPPSLPLPLSGEVIAPATVESTKSTVSPLTGPGVVGPSTAYLSPDEDATTSDPMTAGEASKKRKRGRPPRQQPDASTAGPSSNPTQVVLPLLPQLQGPGHAPPQVEMTEEEYDIQHHKKITAQRNFDKVYFGEWQVKTWYFSPYPLTDTEIDDPPPSSATQIPGVQKASARAHGRTSDLLAGGLGRNYAGGEKAMLWVCQQCFKYMADGNSYGLHIKHCTMDFPPGVKVYQRGAHTIWEVDGAKQKLYCQNLSLFGKLFIDVKTLFFDCDNFLFYILTESTSKQDHMLGFFSKEKVSYDDYNLACIMTLPPYQRKGYGMLMIEFSYELSRRAGRVGTPERPLSDLGLRSYLTYWVSTLVRFFRYVLSALPSNVRRVTSVGGFPGMIRSPSGDYEDPITNGGGDVSNYGNGGSQAGNGGSGNGGVGTPNEAPKKKLKKTKGWAGEVADSSLDQADIPFIHLDDPIFTTQRKFETEQTPDGGAMTHVAVRCTLADIARATHLRVEDAAFALNEIGLLMRRFVDEDEGDVEGETVVISRALVEKVAKERNVKKPCMRMAFILL